MQLKSVPARFFRHKAAVAGLCFIAVTALLAVFARLIASDKSPAANTVHLSLALKPPGFNCRFIQRMPSDTVPTEAIPVNNAVAKDNYLLFQPYSLPEDSLNITEKLPLSQVENRNGQVTYTQTFWLGTDRYGRDILSRMLVGARVSLAVGFVAVFISGLLGLLLGLAAGYFRGKTDALISWLISVVWALPTLLVVIAITLALGKGFWQIFIAVGLTIWVEVARMVRGQVISLRERDFIEAARATGAGDARIVFRHILPNITGPLIVICTANFASAILLEAGLSFLGIGIQPPEPSWGQMLREHYGYIVLAKPYLALIPGLAIMLLVISFNMVGDGLRDALDVRE